MPLLRDRGNVLGCVSGDAHFNGFPIWVAGKLFNICKEERQDAACHFGEVAITFVHREDSVTF